MFKRMFRSKGDGDSSKVTRSERGCQGPTSTPRSNGRDRQDEGTLTPDVEIIERSSSEAILVSDESIAELERSLLHQISRFHSQTTGEDSSGQTLTCTNCTCSGLQCQCSSNSACAGPGPSYEKSYPGQSSPGRSSPRKSSPSKRVPKIGRLNSPASSINSPAPSLHSLSRSPRRDRPGTPRPGTRSPQPGSGSPRSSPGSPRTICINSAKPCPGKQSPNNSPNPGSLRRICIDSEKICPPKLSPINSPSSPRKSAPCPSVVTPPCPATIRPCSQDSKKSCPAVTPTQPCPSSTPNSRYKPCLKQDSSASSSRNESESKDEGSGIMGLIAKFTAWSPIPLPDGSCPGASNPPESRDPSSCPGSSQSRCVHFKDSNGAGVEQLFFNKDIKKSDASIDSGQCVSGECIEQEQPEDLCAIKYCKAQNDESSPCDQQESPTCNGSGAVSDAARAQYYHNKLQATLQVLQNKEETVRVQAASLSEAEARIATLGVSLQNKEETVRVQAASLSEAEARIATLGVRAAQMKRELDGKQAEITELKNQLGRSKKTSDCSTLTDGDHKEVQRQRAMVVTLQKNISVIEELYRECFYESAKQDALIDVLRSSYLDVRLMERESRGGGDTAALQRCQDLAAEVDNLKMEISNFLNSSNNDSGVWGGGSEDSSPSPEVSEDLQQITDQLLALRDVLINNECTCGLQAENSKLKEENEALQKEACELRRRVCELQEAIEEKNSLLQHYKNRLEDHDQQMCCVREEMSALKEESKEKECAFNCLATQVKRAEELLEERTVKLSEGEQRLQELQRQRAEQEDCIAQLKEELRKADAIIKENCGIRNEVSYLSGQVSLWRGQLADSEARVRTIEVELTRARAVAKDLDHCYREKAVSAAALQEQLAAAHTRGAELCAEARRVVCAVRHWVRRMQGKHRDQEQKLRQQAAIIATLNRQLSLSCPAQVELAQRGADTDITGCSKCRANPTEDRSPEIDDTPCPALNRLEMLTQEPPTSPCACGSTTATGSRQVAASSSRQAAASSVCRCSGSGGGSNSSPSSKRSKNSCNSCSSRSRTRTAAVQRPIRRTAGTYFPPSNFAPSTCTSRSPSPTQELYSRVERLQGALCDGVKRWTTRNTHRD